ncbi:MAG TPA: ABC transporter permease subunit [Myxococcota bacterium]|nr:ABC transporter permease subunit [Myxococcota bacterium]
MASHLDVSASPVKRAPLRASVRPSAVARRRILYDRFARVVVSTGGLAVIASILGILAFLVIEVWPLLTAARVSVVGSFAETGAAPAALVLDPDRLYAAGLAPDGMLTVRRLGDGSTTLAEQLLSPGLATAVEACGAGTLAAATIDGRVLLQPVTWDVSFEGEQRRVAPRLGDAAWIDLDPARGAVSVFAAQRGDAGSAAAGVLADGGVAVVRQTQTKQFLTDALTTKEERRTLDAPARPTRLALDRAQRWLYAATADGRLLAWDLARDVATPTLVAESGASPVSALALLVGDRALVVGHADGALDVWFTTSHPDDPARGSALTRVRGFPRQDAAITRIASSDRNRTFLALDAHAGLGLYYSTSDRVLWRGEAPVADGTALAFAPKGDGAGLAAPGHLAVLDVVNPHPEVSWRALFGQVWYEGDPRPSFVWQSSSGSDDFEAKLSLTPLLVGTFKGTFYSLVLAIPLAVLGAIYTSQFMHPRLQRLVKPTVELMASLPSVVLGFLAGLWLAPRVEQSLPSLVFLALGVPVLSLVAGALWTAIPKALRGRFVSGSELVLVALVLVVGSIGLYQLGQVVEHTTFGGSFSEWLFAKTGARYDQRNALVVGIAMGFAVIPIIFAISEDALSNVPHTLTAGSLALGASRWQTVVRVVLPTASAGIFSAVMVGFGRAVGETMIVLMATGNTPIMDWSPFNGFRTLSANIAVEIPEAPVGGSLYRTLFLAALLLFALTFVVNTLAELVRQRLRERYARL